MVTFKPYIHIVKVKGEKTYRVNILTLVLDGYIIKKVLTKKSNNEIRLRVGELKNNLHQGPTETLVYLNNVDENSLIKVIVETKEKALNEYVIEHVPMSEDPSVLGRAVGSTVGVEDEDDREGMEKKTNENADED